jgi:hypothetical protein
MNRGVRGDLISTVHSQMNDQDGVAVLGSDRRDARSGARGGHRS